MAIDKTRIEQLLNEMPEDLQRQVLEFAESLAQKRQNESTANGETSVRTLFGIWDSSDPHSADNDRIDNDLAREYTSPHKAD